MSKSIRFAPWFLALSFAGAGCNDEPTPAAPATPVPAPAVPSPSPSVDASNRAPIAIFKVTPEPTRSNGKYAIRGKSPLKVQFNMCASHDLDGDEVLYTHDFDGDGIDELKGFGGSQCRRSFIYVFSHVVQAQRFEPRQCLTDTDAVTGEHLHPKQCASYVVEVLKK